MPNGVTGEIVYDGSAFVRSSIKEVQTTLIEALLIVSVVIFLFLGSFRAVAIPVIAMPLSLVGAFFVMLVLGYSINLLTLLALVLAIGLVVDDAIIVVENVDRHMKEGKSPFDSAILAARELGGPIIAMTIVLVAVYVPIGFQGGLTGALFSEFAFTVAGAVAVSGIVALTLSPMMTSRIFKQEQDQSRFVRFLDRQFDRLHRRYGRVLHSLLDTWVVIVVMGALLLAGTVYLFMTSKSELAPQEDQGIVLGQILGPPERHAPADAHVREADVRHREIAARVRPDVPDHRGAHHQPGHRRRAVQDVGPAQAQRQRAAAGAAAEVERHRRAPRSRRSSSRRCPAPRACRCRSSSRPPSPSSG